MHGVIIVSDTGVAVPPAPSVHRLDYFEVALETIRDAANEIDHLRPERFDDWGHRARFNLRQERRRGLVRQLEAL